MYLHLLYLVYIYMIIYVYISNDVYVYIFIYTHQWFIHTSKDIQRYTYYYVFVSCHLVVSNIAFGEWRTVYRLSLHQPPNMFFSHEGTVEPVPKLLRCSDESDAGQMWCLKFVMESINRVAPTYRPGIASHGENLFLFPLRLVNSFQH